MRHLVTVLLLIAGCWLFYSAYNWRLHELPIYDESVLGYDKPSVPEEFQGQIQEPIWPEGRTRHGPTVYLENHKSGWLDCVNAFYLDLPYHDGQRWWNAVAEFPGEEPWIVGAPNEVNAARRDGWKKCVAQINQQLEIESASSLRNRLVVSQLPIILILYVLATLSICLALFLTFKMQRPKGET